MAGRTRRHAANTIGDLNSLRPTPPASARGSAAGSLLDITNGTGGAQDLLQKQVAREVAEKSAEISRLSAKTLDLMSKLQARDEEARRMEVALEAAKRERASLQLQLAQKQDAGRGSAMSAPAAMGTPKRKAPIDEDLFGSDGDEEAPAHRHATAGPSVADLIATSSMPDSAVDEGASSATAAPPRKRMKAPRRM